MGTKLGKMTIASLFKKPETIQYPAEHRFVPKGLKGHIHITIEDCIMCGICMKRCPTGAILVEKQVDTWSIDRFRCVQCGSCVRECPQSCLEMKPTYAPVAQKKSIDVVVKPSPSEDEIAAKEAEKAARIKAAKEAKAAREKEQS